MAQNSVDPAKISGLLHEVQTLKHEQIQSRALDPRLALLRQWQSDRLARTYADLTATPAYRAVMRFFLDDIYAARDFSQRNHDMEQMYEFLRHVAPEPLVRPLMLTVELHTLTERLDQQLLDILVNRLGVVDAISVPLYAEAYRLADNYDARVRQIDLISEIGRMLNKAVHVPFSGGMLMLAKASLQRAGWADLMSFMERGYKVFKQLRDTDKFMGIIRERELRILNRIYAGETSPFEFPDVKGEAAAGQGGG